MANRLFTLVTVASLVSAGGMTHAEESFVRETSVGEPAESPGASREAIQAKGIDVAALRAGARVEMRTASVVDLPGVVRMRVIDGLRETALRGQIVAQSDHTLTVCSREGATPVIVAKPNTRLVAVVLGVESGVVRLDLENAEHDVVMLPVTAIAGLRTMPAHDLADEPETMSDLVGESVLIGVGHAVETAPETGEPRSPASHDVVIDGSYFREVPVVGRQRPVLVPAPDSAFPGKVETADGDVLTVQLLGRSQVITVPRTAITSLQVRRRYSQGGKGALVGAGTGVLLGLGLVVYNHAVNHCVDDGDDPGLCTTIDGVATVGLSLSGAIIGAVAGALTHEERWERVDTQRLRFSVVPDRHGGVRGGLSVRF
jgi:hypothetical protein